MVQLRRDAIDLNAGTPTPFTATSTAQQLMASYPDEPFGQANSLLTGLIENYRSSSDANDLADIQNMVEEAVRTAQDREFRVQDSIKGDSPTPSLCCCSVTQKRHIMSARTFCPVCLSVCAAELSQKVASAEADAVYSDARARHEQEMKEINTVIVGVQQEVQQLNNDLR